MHRITTPIVETQTKFDQRDSMFSKAAAGTADHPLIRRWIEVEAPDPLIRALMGIPRTENSLLHHLISAIDGPLNPEPVPIDDTRALTDKIKALARYFGADLVGVCRLNQNYVVSNRGDEYSFGTAEWGRPVELNHRFAISLGFKRNFESVFGPFNALGRRFDSRPKPPFNGSVAGLQQLMTEIFEWGKATFL